MKQIAVAQHDSIVLTPSGRPVVDNFCGKDDGLTLGGAISHAHADLIKPRKSKAASTSARTTAAATSAAVRVTAPGVSQPDGRSVLRAAFENANAEDPEPYMGAHPNVYFMSPSGNIGCYIFVDYGNRVECTISKYEFSQPGSDCALGAVVTIDEGGVPSVPTCSPVALYPQEGDVLQYGNSLTNGSLACVSASVGVSCLDLTTGNGFTLSRQNYVTVG